MVVVVSDTLQLTVYMGTAECVGSASIVLVVIGTPAIVDCHTLEMRKHPTIVDTWLAPFWTADKECQVLGGCGMHPVVLATDADACLVKADATLIPA